MAITFTTVSMSAPSRAMSLNGNLMIKRIAFMELHQPFIVFLILLYDGFRLSAMMSPAYLYARKALQYLLLNGDNSIESRL